MDENFNIVLVEPEIPQNTGNIARLCACTGCNLYIAGKTGFLMTDKYMKRSGLDYWDKLNLIKVDTLEELIESKCIGIIVYPIIQKQTIGTLYKKVHISDLDYESFKDKLLKRINIPIFTFNTVMNTDVLVELITDYFSEPKGILE